MKRPLAVSAVALVIGIIIAEKVPSFIHGLCAVILVCIAACLAWRRITCRSPFLLLALPFLVSGFLLHHYNSRAVSTRFLPWLGRKVVVEGSIHDEPVFSDGRITFTLSVDTVIENGVATPIRKGKIRVRVYSDNPLDELRYGRMVQISAEVEIPAGQRNIGGFDYRRYLAARGISGVCSINPLQLKVLEGNRGFFLKSAGYAVRKGILDALYKTMSRQEASVAAGMLIGYTDEMPESLEEAFRKAGLSHIMAVSGANLAFLLLPFIWLLKRIGLNPRWASVISLPVMLIYVFATGMEASVIRAAIMAGIMLLGMIIWRQTDFFCSISASAMLILLSNTFMLFDTGFILSYSASISLVVFYKPIFDRLPAKIPKVIRDTLAGTLSAQLGVIPVIAGTFNTFSVVSILANLAVVPITGVLTTLTAILAVLWFVFQPVCHALGLAASFIIGVILGVTRTISSLPWAELDIATPGFLLTAGYYLILLAIRYGIPWMERRVQDLRPSAADKPGNAVREMEQGYDGKGKPEENKSEKSRRKRFGWLVPCILAFYGVMILLDMVPSGKLEIYFADVGQGDCSIIRTPSGKSIIVDGGGSVYDDESSYTGEMIVVPVLYDLKITRIDVMVATHGHADHIKGLKSVIDSMRVKRLVVADADDSEMNELTDYARSRGIPVERADQDDIVYSEDGLMLTAIYPLDDKTRIPSGRTASANELSLVIRLDYAGFSAVFTGDIGSPAENLILGQEALDCDLIKVPHHGSKYSSGAEFVRQASPAIAVISVGKNRYGHPDGEVKKRYMSAGARIYETLHHGGIMVSVDPRKPGQVSVRTVIKE
ncbi:MAG: DUF4131 domain-containing protein [Clostridiaceae bacterium]|nr:DUF4131 domain-containing protein [Clostridiaceae bacterium]